MPIYTWSIKPSNRISGESQVIKGEKRYRSIRLLLEKIQSHFTLKKIFEFGSLKVIKFYLHQARGDFKIMTTNCGNHETVANILQNKDEKILIL